MSDAEDSLLEARLAALRGRLLEWLVGAAYPLWSQQGIDPVNGGFVELIDQDALPMPEQRRISVQPRQISAFALATSLGWRGDVPRIVQNGIDYLSRYYRRDDGLYRTLASAEGAPLDERALFWYRRRRLSQRRQRQTVCNHGDVGNDADAGNPGGDGYGG